MMMDDNTNSYPPVLCVILARGGSKSIPKKNIAPLLGVPLIAYTILEAKRSKLISRVLVSTDDKEIAEVAMQYGAEVPFMRPAEMATDVSNSHDAFRHAVYWAEGDEGREYEYMVELLCTNPMKTADDIDAALTKLIDKGADSVIGVTRLEDHHPIRIKKIEDDRIQDFCFPEVPGMNRQQLKPDAYIRNGSIYACRRAFLHQRIGSENSRPHIMPAERSVNIDTPIDLIVAEALVKLYPRPYIQPAIKSSGEASS